MPKRPRPKPDREPAQVTIELTTGAPRTPAWERAMALLLKAPALTDDPE
jgi:hypothetical protein